MKIAAARAHARKLTPTENVLEGALGLCLGDPTELDVQRLVRMN